MLFPTVSFAVFFLIAFTVSWLLRPAYRVWLWVMTAISFWFYAASDLRFLWLLAFSIVWSWALGALAFRALAADGERTPLSTNLVRVAVVVDLAAARLVQVLRVLRRQRRRPPRRHRARREPAAAAHRAARSASRSSRSTPSAT